ncbi:DUF3306 domain-containing protein [Methylobacterium sp. ID0610]|uniref:DUF3306 domain-containing protein n=1 Tax=Methylobacterium carpenticola TaxID=3344827 RepID=UPI00367BC47F
MSEDFLSRWARRKRAVRAAEEAERATAAEDQTASAVAASPGTEAAAGVPDPLSDPGPPERPEAEDPQVDLPPLESLTPESDLAPFLRVGVPAVLRNAALRRMWSLDPAIRDFVSEAREYAYDWNSPGGVPGLGPLLPSDDVQAMLRRIVDGPPQEALTPADGLPRLDEDEAASPAAPATAERAMAEAAAPPAETMPTVQPASDAPSQQPDARSPARDPAPRSEAASRPRVRRHGGAMPA